MLRGGLVRREGIEPPVPRGRLGYGQVSTIAHTTHERAVGSCPQSLMDAYEIVNMRVGSRRQCSALKVPANRHMFPKQGPQESNPQPTVLETVALPD